MASVETQQLQWDSRSYNNRANATLDISVAQDENWLKSGRFYHWKWSPPTAMYAPERRLVMQTKNAVCKMMHRVREKVHIWGGGGGWGVETGCRAAELISAVPGQACKQKWIIANITSCDWYACRVHQNRFLIISSPKHILCHAASNGSSLIPAFPRPDLLAKPAFHPHLWRGSALSIYPSLSRIWLQLQIFHNVSVWTMPAMLMCFTGTCDHCSKSRRGSYMLCFLGVAMRLIGAVQTISI